MRLKNKVALVIGGGRGLGKATALLFAAEGADIAVVARTKKEIEAVAKEAKRLGKHAIAIKADATKLKKVQEAVNKTIETYGKIDILVNSQGDWLIKPTLQTSEEDWGHIIDTNLKSVYLTCRTVLPHMIAQKSGPIFNIGSASGLWYPGGGIITIYKASKMGLTGFNKALAEEQAPNGIGVHLIAPHPMDTPMRWESTPSADKPALIRPEVVADLIVTIASHPELRISEGIVPEINLPYTSSYKKG
jgi:NAD(P)-dependent dehydrogenase (short-subunit alcohol dehydrogenase family)